MTPDPIILFELLVQLRGFTVISPQPLIAAHLTSIHSFQFIGRIPIVTLRQSSENLAVSQLAEWLTDTLPTGTADKGSA